MAPIGPLAWEPPYAMGAAPEKAKRPPPKKKKKRKEKKERSRKEVGALALKDKRGECSTKVICALEEYGSMDLLDSSGRTVAL